MAGPDSFSIAIAPDVSASEREALLLALRDLDFVDLREPTARHVPPEVFRAGWETFVAVMRDLQVVAGGATAMIALAQKLNDWRRQARGRGVEPRARLERPGQPPLDLATASDEQVLQWLLEAAPDSGAGSDNAANRSPSPADWERGSGGEGRLPG